MLLIYSVIKRYEIRMKLQKTGLLLCLLLSNNVFADNSQIEYQVKAGYLYNFTKFVYWTQNDLETFNLCLVGKDYFGDLIKPLEKKQVLGKPIRLFRYPDLKDSFQHCHILYFAQGAIKKPLPKNIFRGILTIGEEKHFIEQGGMLNFVLKNDRIKLQINITEVRENGLEMSAKLLEIAEIVEKKDD